MNKSTNAQTEQREPLLDSLCINYMVILATTFKNINDRLPTLDKGIKIEIASSIAWDLARKVPFGVMMIGSRTIPAKTMKDLEEVFPEEKPTRRIIKSKSIDNRHETA